MHVVGSDVLGIGKVKGSTQSTGRAAAPSNVEAARARKPVPQDSPSHPLHQQAACCSTARSTWRSAAHLQLRGAHALPLQVLLERCVLRLPLSVLRCRVLLLRQHTQNE